MGLFKKSTVKSSANSIKSNSSFSSISSTVSKIFKSSTKQQITEQDIRSHYIARPDQLEKDPEADQLNALFVQHLANNPPVVNSDLVRDQTDALADLFSFIQEFHTTEAQFLQELETMQQGLIHLRDAGCTLSEAPLVSVGLMRGNGTLILQNPRLSHRLDHWFFDYYNQLLRWMDQAPQWLPGLKTFALQHNLGFPEWEFHAPIRRWRYYRFAAWQIMQYGMSNPKADLPIQSLVRLASRRCSETTTWMSRQPNVDSARRLMDLEASLELDQVIYNAKWEKKALTSHLLRPRPESLLGFPSEILFDQILTFSTYNPQFASENQGQKLRMVLLSHGLLVTAQRGNARWGLIHLPLSSNQLWIMNPSLENGVQSLKFDINGPFGWREILQCDSLEQKNQILEKLESWGVDVQPANGKIKGTVVNFFIDPDDVDALDARLSRVLHGTTLTKRHDLRIINTFSLSVWKLVGEDWTATEEKLVDFLSNHPDDTWVSARTDDEKIHLSQVEVSPHPNDDCFSFFKWSQGAWLLLHPSAGDAAEFRRYVEKRKDMLRSVPQVIVQEVEEPVENVQEPIQEQVETVEQDATDELVQQVADSTSTLLKQINDLENQLDDLLMVSEPTGASPDTHEEVEPIVQVPQESEVFVDAAEELPEPVTVVEPVIEQFVEAIQEPIQQEPVQEESIQKEPVQQEPMQEETTQPEVVPQVQVHLEVPEPSTPEPTSTSTLVEAKSPQSELQKHIASMRNKAQSETNEWQLRIDELEDLLKQRDQEIHHLRQEVENYKVYTIQLRDEKWDLEESLQLAKATITKLERMK